LLLTRNDEGALEISFGFRCIPLWRFKRDFAGNAIDLGVAPFSTAVIASSMQRRASSNWPSSAYALPRYDECNGIQNAVPGQWLGSLHP
jgi:hypothetical protein